MADGSHVDVGLWGGVVPGNAGAGARSPARGALEFQNASCRPRADRFGPSDRPAMPAKPAPACRCSPARRVDQSRLCPYRPRRAVTPTSLRRPAVATHVHDRTLASAGRRPVRCACFDAIPALDARRARHVHWRDLPALPEFRGRVRPMNAIPFKARCRSGGEAERAAIVPRSCDRRAGRGRERDHSPSPPSPERLRRGWTRRRDRSKPRCPRRGPRQRNGHHGTPAAAWTTGPARLRDRRRRRHRAGHRRRPRRVRTTRSRSA